MIDNKRTIFMIVCTVILILCKQDRATAAIVPEDNVQRAAEGDNGSNKEPQSPSFSNGSGVPLKSIRSLKTVSATHNAEESVLALAADGRLSYRIRPLDSERIVIDLMNVVTKLRQFSDLKGGMVKQVRMGKHPGSIRLVIDLQKPAVYSVRESKDALLITLTAQAAAKRPKQTTPESFPMPNGDEALPQENVTKVRAQAIQISTDNHTAPLSGALENTAAAPQPHVRGERASNRQSEIPRIAAEPYVAVYGGITIPQSLQHAKSADPTIPVTISNIDLARSGIGGIKLGVFQPSGVRWFGIETEFFYTNPHIKQQNITVNTAGVPTTDTFTGAHMRVATWALNWIVRYPGEKFQPYAGVGLGLFWARLSGNSGGNAFGTATDTSLGLNALAGLRFVLLQHVVMFGEYKYNRASFDFGNDVSIHALYQAHNFVGGLSWQF